MIDNEASKMGFIGALAGSGDRFKCVGSNCDEVAGNIASLAAQTLLWLVTQSFGEERLRDEPKERLWERLGET